MLLHFMIKGVRYRMRVAKVHEHPGERDRIEKATLDMLGDVSWHPLPDGSLEVPSPEWLIRRTLWKYDRVIGDTIDLGKLS